MRKLALLLILIAQAAYAAPSYKRTITIDHTKCGSSDSTNFPVLINTTDTTLKTVANGGHVQSSSGYDIRVYSDSGLTTALTYQLDYYDGTGGTVVMWVLVSTLSSSSDTVIYLAYGDSGLSSDGSSTSTFDTNYKQILHGGDGSTVDVTDKGQSGHNATNNGATASSGKIGGSLTFGGAAYVDMTNQADFRTANGTVSAWVKNSSDTDQNIWAFGHSATNDYSIEIGPSTGTLSNELITAFVTTPSAGTYGYTTATRTQLFDGNWHYVVLTANGTTGILYLDGVSKTLSVGSGSNVGQFTNSGAIDKFRFGENINGANPMSGDLDEVRFSNSVRGADWVLAEYNNQGSPSTFYTFGSETPLGAGSTTISGSGSTTISGSGSTTVTP